MSESGEKKAIIIVEDDGPVAQIIKDTLNAETEYRAVVVDDGVKAIEVIHAVQISGVILDIALPGLDGLQIYDALQADPTTRGMPIIFVTATYVPDEFTRRGITNILAKPFNLDDLLARVAQACGAAKPPPPLPLEIPAEVTWGAEGQAPILDAREHDLDTITYFLAAPD